MLQVLLEKQQRTTETQKRSEAVKKEPSGKDLLKTLVDLLADQEGVKITCEIETKE